MAESNPPPAAPPPAPAPERVVHAIDPSISGPPLDVFVKGGTTSQRWDDEKKEFYASTEARQAHQDRQREAVAHAHQHGGAIAGLHSMELLHKGHPKIVLHYKKRDTALETDAECEIMVQPDPSDPAKTIMSFALVCPKCLERTGRQLDSQIQIRSDQKEFWLRSATEPDFPQDKKIWVNHMENRPVLVAGTVTVRDICRCTALGCNYAFRIDDSVVYEV